MSQQPYNKPFKRSKQHNNNLTGNSNLTLLDNAIATIIQSALQWQAFHFKTEIKHFKSSINGLIDQLRVLQTNPGIVLVQFLTLTNQSHGLFRLLNLSILILQCHLYQKESTIVPVLCVDTTASSN
eukprot:TRINITY_DN8294_c0_g3_i1.p1 TRINITY_DN8294_c0_g3~~TRINITY_DN8294_c0_g3_i1.p1  ORF type:complete len:126 (+),score=3.50 TRINITY_DN8294_c0_g3_i1:281-658(+)